MSKIDQLINRLCPDGVEYRTLGSLEDAGLITLGRGKVISKKDIQNNPGDYPIYSSSATNNGLLGSYGDYMFDEELITWSIDGGGKFFYRPASRYSVTNVCGWLRVNDDQINTKYLYHTLLNEWHKKVFDYVHKAHPSTIRKEYAIPIPPLEVQSEIVRILDNFTELTTELTTELASRKKQYEYYKSTLLSDEYLGANCDSVRKMRVDEICNISRGVVISKDFIRDNPGDYPVYSSQTENDGVLGKINSYSYDGEYITWTTDGANAGTVFRRIGKFNITNVCGLLRVHREDVLLDYLYYALSFQAKKYVSSGMGNPKLMSNVMSRIVISVPSIDLQKRIVSSLNRFDGVCYDVIKGIPAEIGARRKQYEFYRDKLLAFDELKVA